MAAIWNTTRFLRARTVLADFVFLELSLGCDMQEILQILCSFLLWLILCGNWVRSWYLAIWSGMSE